MKTSNRVTKQIVITGATSGIGLSLAEQFLEKGEPVHGVARSRAKLMELAAKYPQHFTFTVADISEKEAWELIEADLEAPPSWLVLNAGNCQYFEEGKVDSEITEKLIKINFLANVYAAEQFTHKMNQVKGSKLVVMSSSASYFPFAKGEAYGASKAALNYFFKSLRASFINIDIVMVYPGFVDTPLTQKNTFKMPMQISSDEAASIIIDKVKKGSLNINFPWLFTLFIRFLGALPDATQRLIAKRMIS